MFYCTVKPIEIGYVTVPVMAEESNFFPASTQCRLLFWKGQKAKIKINQNLNQRMKTKVWRKKGSVRRDDLPWLPESKGLDTGSSTWKLRTLAIKKMAFVG